MTDEQLTTYEQWRCDCRLCWSCHNAVAQLVAEVRRLQAEVARMHLNTTPETRAEWADPT